MSAILSVRDLCVDYLTATGPAHAVSHVSLDLEAGEFLAIVGESGCGKTTLLFAVAQLLSLPGQRDRRIGPLQRRRTWSGCSPRSCAGTAGATSRSSCRAP